MEVFAREILEVKLVGFFDPGPDTPTSTGNCFSVLLSTGVAARIVNFGYENLEKLFAKGLTLPVRVVLLSERIAAIHDPRIGERWYNHRWCELCCPKEFLPIPQIHAIEREVMIGRREECDRSVCIKYGVEAEFK